MSGVHLTWRGKQVERATQRALSKSGSDALRALRVDASRKVRERKRIRLADVNKNIVLDFSQKERLIWRAIVKDMPTPVYAYSARQTGKGVSAEINVKSRQVIQHAFIAEMRSGHKGVFMRYGEKRIAPVQGFKGHERYAGQRRQAIRELFTTKLTDVFRDADFMPDVLGKAESVFHRSFTRLLPLELEKV